LVKTGTVDRGGVVGSFDSVSLFGAKDKVENAELMELTTPPAEGGDPIFPTPEAANAGECPPEEAVRIDCSIWLGEVETDVFAKPPMESTGAALAVDTAVTLPDMKGFTMVLCCPVADEVEAVPYNDAFMENDVDVEVAWTVDGKGVGVADNPANGSSSPVWNPPPKPVDDVLICCCC